MKEENNIEKEENKKTATNNQWTNNQFVKEKMVQVVIKRTIHF